MHVALLTEMRGLSNIVLEKIRKKSGGVFIKYGVMNPLVGIMEKVITLSEGITPSIQTFSFT